MVDSLSGAEERRENSPSRELKSLYIIPQHKRERAKRVFLGNSEYQGTPKSPHMPPADRKCRVDVLDNSRPWGRPTLPPPRGQAAVTVREQIKLTNDREASYLSCEILSLLSLRKVVSDFLKRQEVYGLHGEVTASFPAGGGSCLRRWPAVNPC